jgi:uncharacterized membrane protein
MHNNDVNEKNSRNDKKMAGLRNLDFILGGFLIVVQIVTYITESRAGKISYEAGNFIFGILGAVLLIMGVLATPKKNKSNTQD